MSLSAAVAVLVAGCPTSSSEVGSRPGLGLNVDAQAINASLLGKPRVAEATSSFDTATVAPMSVTGELLAAAIQCIEEQTRAASPNIADAQKVAYKRRVVHVTTAAVDFDGQRYQVPIVEGVDTIQTAGVIEVTDRALDLAIDSHGVFEVILPGGASVYTRDGSLQVSAEG